MRLFTLVSVACLSLGSSLYADQIADLKGALALQQAKIVQLQHPDPLPPRYLGQTVLPVNYSKTMGTSWESIQTGVAFDVANMYGDALQSGEKLQTRLCMSYADSCTPDANGHMEVRIAAMNGYGNITGTVQNVGVFYTTWSGSALYKYNCSAWTSPDPLLNSCGANWGMTCQIQAHRTISACGTNIASAHIEWRATR